MPGEIGIVYHKMVGLQYVFLVIEMAEPQSFCNTFGMGTANIEISAVLGRPVPSSELRAHSTFRKLRAVRRNFQQNWFDIEPEHLEPLLEFLRGRE